MTQQSLMVLSFLYWLTFSPLRLDVESSMRFDVVVYGGTASGVAAAVQADRMGKTVVLVEPGKHLGGLTSGALGATDIGNKGAIGGISREFYQRVKLHYQRPSAWRMEASQSYRLGGHGTTEDAMWFFEPKTAEAILRGLLSETDVVVLQEERLLRNKGVDVDGQRITSITTESGRQLIGKCYIDTTYEGDLMAAAGVSYVVGRESNRKYNETLNGVQTAKAVYHQIQPGVSPYLKPGDVSSGLLPGVEAGPPAPDGSGDHRVQAYNLRICATDHPDNRVPFKKPENYQPLEYELLLRNFEAGEARIPWNPLMMPNRKTDANNNFGVSTDYIGQNYQWADADYATRVKIYQAHLTYTQGLMWTLANHPRVPKHVRDNISRWGTCQDEFTENGGWTHQLYVREARRMVADYVMTQHDCQGRRQADDVAGLAAYTMDSHHVQRYVDSRGDVRNEGDVQVGGFPPYPISYRSIVPRQSECTNLLVPVCLSASHIAFGSIRMEPVFMVLGQTAATAACQSIDQQCEVQRVDYAQLRSRLLEDKQVLVWQEAEPSC